jgi:ABC-type multidrug transport system ATPase subunit
MVSIDRVRKAFASRAVLCGVTLSIERGERVVILGENGCGKSTLLSIVAGVAEADSGEVVVPRPVGYAPERPDIPEHLFVREWLDVVASLKRTRWDMADLELVAVRPLLGKRVGALSLGQRQRVSLTAALLGHPPLLVLDEPTNALDTSSRAALLAHLRETTALVATHDQTLARDLGARTLSMQAGVFDRE